jgi:hypothetical protein
MADCYIKDHNTFLLQRTVRRRSAWTLGKRGPYWKLGELRGPARQSGEQTDSWRQIVKAGRRYKMSERMGDGRATTSSHVYAQSMYLTYIVSQPIAFNNHNMNRVLLYLFVSGE